MVARKSPLGQRLDNAHRGYGSRMFRGDVPLKELTGSLPSVNSSGSRDWLGWGYVHMEGMSSYDYGSVVSLGRDVVSYVTYVFEEKKLMVNRCPMKWDGSGVTVHVEFVDPRGNEISGPMMKLLDVELSRIGHELERVYRGKGLSGLKVRFTQHPLLNRFKKNEEWSAELKSFLGEDGKGSGSRLYDGKDPRRQVTEAGVRSVMMLASFWPVAPLLCQMIVHRLERTMKHEEVVSDIREKLVKVGASKEFGLLNHISVAEDKSGKSAGHKGLGAAFGLRIRGGYRGYLVKVTGTLDGARRTYKVEAMDGVIPLSRVSLPVSHASGVAKTKIGTLGVHVTYSY